MKYTLEIIGFTIEGCRVAQSAGAHRIELCDSPGDGGTTPSFAFIWAARKLLHIGLYPIIRPRGGDFLYTDDEFLIMKEDIRIAKQAGCDGIVTGILTAAGNIDMDKMKEICALAYPLGVTFHRAFDRTRDPEQALEEIIACGCERVLTSGQQTTATEGIPLIKKLVELADERISIMPGSGVSSENLSQLLVTGATEFHSSARIKVKSAMEYIHPNMAEELQSLSVDESEIKKMLALLQSFTG